MSLYVVDASVAAKWFVPENLSEEASRLLQGEHELACPDLLFPELGNILWKKVHIGELTSPDTAAILRALDRFPLAVFPSRPLLEGTMEIAIATRRSVYDCLYLTLALALDCRLVTADRRFANALGQTPLSTSILWVGASGGIP